MSPTFPQLRRLHHSIFYLLLFALIISVPGASPTPASANVQPSLWGLAMSTPDTVVPVIIQMTPTAPSLGALLAKLGGRQTKDLYLINALVAEVPARQLPALAAQPGVRWISLDEPVVETACAECVPTTDLRTVYNQAINADDLWNTPPYLQGHGVGVAIVDSGIQKFHGNLAGRVVAGVSTVLAPAGYDGYGHGTFVAGVAGGEDSWGKRRFIGTAPQSNLVDVKVTTTTGAATESDVVAGLQWIYEHHQQYNIRVVNLSLNASAAQSYHTSPLAAACEILWFNGIVVVTSAGNRGEGTIFPPANDPFVITVGAADDMGTPSIADDSVAHFSAFGATVDGFAKPDLIAPGRHIVAPMASQTALLPLTRPEIIVNSSYMRMSGTSFAAPMVSGAIALLLEDEPQLTPDQVKYRLMATANRNWAGYDAAKAGAGYLDIAAAVHAETTESANTGVAVSHLLTTGTTGLGQLLGTLLTLNWDSVSWSSVSWSSVSWSSVSWSSVSWSSDYWEDRADLPGLLGSLLREGEAESTLPSSSEDAMANEAAALPIQLYLPLISDGE